MMVILFSSSTSLSKHPLRWFLALCSRMLLTLTFLSYQAILPRVIHKRNSTHNILLARNTYEEEKVNADGE